MTWNKIIGSGGGNGEDGKSTYQIWLDLGNTGTEQDFINSLKGATGATGPAGTNSGNFYRGNRTVSNYAEIIDSGLWYVNCSDLTKYPFTTTTTQWVLLYVEVYNWAGAEYRVFNMFARDTKKYYVGYVSGMSTTATITWNEPVFQESNPFRTSQILMYGDSITATPYGKPEIIEYRTGCKVTRNAHAGSSISKRGDDGTYDNKSLVERTKAGTAFASDLTNFDNVIIFMGTNDGPRDGIGAINDGDSDGNYNEYTLYGALNKVVHNLYNQKNDINIIFVTPSNTGFANRTAMLAAKDAIIAIAAKYKFPCFNMTDEGGINDLNTYYRAQPTDRKSLLWDGLHPTENGARLIFSKIAGFAMQHVRTKV